MIFENRNKDLTNLHKAADYLGRSLGENLKILSVDSQNNAVSFLSEGEDIICCKYDMDGRKLRLSQFVVESAADALSPERLEDEIQDTISSFLASLREGKFDTADTSFDDILDLFEKRNSLGNYTCKMQKHSESFGKMTRVIESKEFKDLEELRDNLVDFVKANLEDVKSNKDIMEAAKINSAMCTAFKVSKISWDELSTIPEFVINLEEGNSLYEMVCQQELVRQELLEAKSSMADIWITNENVQKLSSMIFAKDRPTKEALAETIEDVPYFAFSTKADLTEMLTSLYEVNTTDVITKKDTKEFVRKIYEWKKPVKEELIKILDEKYGINVTNLKFVPTFNNLAKSNSVMCEVLSMLGENKSVVNDVMKSFSTFIAKKGGVEVLAISEFLSDCLREGGVEIIEENMLMQYIDMPRLARDLMALKILIGGDAALGGEGGEAEFGGADEEVPPEGEVEGEGEFPEEEFTPPEEGEDPGQFSQEEAPGEGVDNNQGEFAPEDQPQPGQDPSQHDVGAEDSVPVNGEEVPPEGGQVPPGAEGEEGEVALGDDSVEDSEVAPNPKVNGGGMTNLVSDLEALVAGLGLKKPTRPGAARPGNAAVVPKRDDRQYGP